MTWIQSALAALALILLGPGFALAAKPKPAPVRLLVPAYFYPAGDGLAAWKRLLSSAEKAPVVAIVNPDSGPGQRVDDNYSAVLRLAKTSQATLIGYVTLGYGKRPLSAVKADIDRWLDFYPGVAGVFLDEQPSQADQAPVALASFSYARRRFPNGLIVSNPGVVCAREYLGGNDGPSICVFEQGTGFDAFALPDWSSRFGPERFAVLIYNVQSADLMRQRFREALRKRAGLLYITDAPGTMPWGRLPSYWDDELTEAARAIP